MLLHVIPCSPQSGSAQLQASDPAQGLFLHWYVVILPM
jgi:hypothetical protein